MGQNRKIGEGQSNDLSITEKELREDSANEHRLFRLQIVIVIIISSLAILREVFFPSNIALLEMIRGLV